MQDAADQYVNWFFQCCFAAATLSIVSGAMAERTKLEGYALYMAFLSIVIYPPVACWVWNVEGWLFKRGYVDYAGGSVVHSVGGVCAFAGTFVLKPRLWKFGTNGEVRSIPGHNIALAATGTLILWFGWFGFNCGSTLKIVGVVPIASLSALNTMLCPSVGFITSLFLSKYMEKSYNLELSMNAALAGLVAITPCAVFIRPYWAVLLGVTCVFVYVFLSKLILRFKVDDPLDASPLHFGCGAYGILYIGLFAEKEYLVAFFGDTYPLPAGLFYSGSFSLFLTQSLGIFVIIVWCLFWGLTCCYLLKRVDLLRVGREEELSGLDSAVGGQAEILVDLQTKQA
eukprot:ANDGO_01437.mRNA.1 Ammonium transporter 1 member 1